MINPDIKQINTTALAYMGDAVYEVYIRKHVMETGHVHVDRLHAMAVPYVKAEGQYTSTSYGDGAIGRNIPNQPGYTYTLPDKSGILPRV